MREKVVAPIGAQAMADTVKYELVGGLNSFEFPDAAGTLIRIGAAGYTTDDPRVIGELDVQTHAVQRAAKSAAKPKKKS